MPLTETLLSTLKLLEIDGFDAILAATVNGFGFVFIHPFEDGNGRLHRSIIQKALIDGGFNPPGVILPISAAILDDIAGYKTVLEDFSLPTLGAIEWMPAPEGNVQVMNDTAYLYRYFDETRQAEYLTDRIERAIIFEVPNELQYIEQFDDAKRCVAEIADMPDRLSSLLIQFCAQDGGTVSDRKRREYFPDVSDDRMAELERAVQDSGIAGMPPVPG